MQAKKPLLLALITSSPYKNFLWPMQLLRSTQLCPKHASRRKALPVPYGPGYTNLHELLLILLLLLPQLVQVQLLLRLCIGYRTVCIG